MESTYMVTGRMRTTLMLMLALVISLTATTGYGQDCNGNGVLDTTDIAGGTSQDCNTNGVPDDCDGIDITTNGSFIGLVFELVPPGPQGGGNPDPEVMRDGIYPPVGSSSDATQFDTFHFGDQVGEDWIGYTFDAPRQFNGITFQEGKQFENGGWFTTLTVQVLNDGVWSDVPSLSVAPTYSGENGLSFETFELRFQPLTGDAIRLYGTLGGGATFISVGELRVYEDAPDCNNNGVLDECEADSDGDSFIDACDGCPTDPTRIVPGICGCNADEPDGDGDGAADCIDPCPADPVNACINPGLTAMFVETFQSLPTASGVELGDVDGDGDLDAFLATFNAPEKVLLNDGNGFFVDSGQDLGFSFSDKVRLADLDKDGDVDALVGLEAGSGVAAWINNGHGNFVIGQIFATGAPSGNAVGDVDGDGDQDLLIVGGSQGRFWLNDGTATFTSGSVFSFGSEVSPELGDLDGDGDLDAFIGRNGANKVLFNNGSGTFTDSGQNLGNIQCFEVRLADFDGDGDLDAFESGGNFTSDSFWINDGNGFFTAGQTFGDSHGRGITVGDIDLDGDVDMIHSVLGTGRLFVNDGTGMVANMQALPNMKDAALGDLDGDGDLDAFIVNAVTNSPTTVFKNTLNHRNAKFTFAGLTQTGSDSRDIEVGDFDADGDLDAMIVNVGGQPNTVWLNDGAGGYTDSLQSLGTGGSFGIALGDVNRDGALDAFVANNGANTVWLGDGGGGFSDSGQALGTATSREVALGDLNGDGHIDAFVANSSANSVWLNDDASPGQFINTQSVGSGDWQDVVLGDIDSDGDLDAVTVTQTLAQVWENDSTGTFSVGASFAQTNARGLAVGDLDDDGDLDVYVANIGAADEVWLNDGLGGFVFNQAFGSAASTAVRLGDVDHDGDLDAVVTDGSAAPSKVWLNDGAAFFTDSGIAISANVSGQGLALGDIDADGDLDVLTVTCCSQSNSVWLNTGGQFGLPTVDITPGVIEAGEIAAVLAIAATHNGRAMDAGIELATFELLFESAPGIPLDPTIAASRIENLLIYLDDGNGVFESGVDQLVELLGPPSLTSGIQTITFTDGDPLVQVAIGAPRMYFVALEMSTNLPQDSLTSFDVTHLTEASSTAQDAIFNRPLTLEFSTNVTATVILPDPPDCNSNGVGDFTDIDSGTSQDCNVNNMPDECETDCNANGTPDECETFVDCNTNGVPDECEADCNDNGTADACEVFADCNTNGVPDECEADCNNNGRPDDCDLTIGSLYWSVSGTILGVDADGNDSTTILSSSTVLDLEVDPGKKVYWIRQGTGIMRADLDGSNQETVLSSSMAIGLALDLAGGKMFYGEVTDGLGNGRLMRANLDGSNVQTVSSGFSDPIALAIDPLAGKFYMVWANGTRIWRGNLDGSGLQFVAVVQNVNDVAVDPVGGKLYWASFLGTIGQSDLDGSNEQTFLTGQPTVYAVDVDWDGGKLYWASGSGGSKTIRRANLDASGIEILIGGGFGTVISNLDFVPPSADCNANDTPDECESDCDDNGTPDECQVFIDCNVNGIFDACEIDADTSLDCNASGVPDDCELVGNDCDANLVPDECDPDGDSDSVPDDCDVCLGDDLTGDSDADGVCDSDDVCPGGDDNFDTDGDGVADFCDDCPADNPDDTDGDGVCDSADVCPGGDDNVDTDSDSVPDACDACAGGAASGDTDGDGNLDLDDFAACLFGPGGGLGTDCECFDFDSDGDNDLLDFAEFQANFTGS